MAAPKLLPIGFVESVNLSTLNVAPSDVVFKNVSIQSGKYVTVREESKNQVAIIDVAAKTVLRLPVQVDSAIMNPVSKVIALRAGNNLQIYNLEMKTKMKTTTMDETVVYWKWLDQKTIAIVTDKAAYHWSMDGDAVPAKMFDRAAHESPVQIINYRSSADGKWLLLGGIAASAAGTVEGVLQVFSVDLKASQPKMDAHTACFAQVTLDGRDKPSQLFCFTMRTAAGPKLNIIEVGVPKETAFNKSAPMAYDDKDFPVAMLPDNNHGSLFVLTKAGMLFLYEIQSGKSVFANKVSANTMFASIEIEGSEGGILTVDQTGRVAKFFVDEKNIVPYICNVMNDYDLGVQMARRNNLPGAEGIFKQQFQRLIQSQRYDEAMELAASSPQGVLRNMETIQILKATDGGKALLQYFQALLKKGQLNSIESIELSKLVLAKGGIDHIKGWLKEQKLAASEELGDILRSHNVQLALSVYLRANVPEKVIGCFLSLGAQESETEKANEHFRNILAYAQRVNFTPDYPILVQQLCRVNSERAKDFAVLLLQHSDGPKLDLNGTVDTFIHMGDIKSATSILLEYLKSRGDNEADAALQTKLLEINLLHSPQVADAIFESSDYKFTHYDHLRIAQLCERAQLYQRALEHYTDLTDIKRVLTTAASAQMLNPEFVLEYFGRMTPSNCLECLRDLLKYNLAQNIRLVVEVAKKWSDHLTPEALVSMFEDFKAYNGIFYYLGSMVNFTENQTVVFKYIEAAVKLDQVKEVERIARDNNHYDPKQVKEFLLSQNLKDPRPLIHVCDRFDYVEELTAYLYNKNMFMFIEAYVQRMNAKATPSVLGALLDLNSPDDQISKLLSNVRPPVDDKQWFERLVEQVEKRNRLKLLKPYLEARATEGSQEVHVHNGLAKIYIETNNNAANFLTNNKFHDSAVVGAFAESRDPHLAFIAYKRAWGTCDDQLVSVCNKNGFFKDLARYLVERQDLDLWAKVLQEDNPYRRQLIDQVVATALPESRLPEEVSTTVKAFMAANLPNELMELLERIILHGPSDGEFQSNKNLQNLLILTAIKADKKRVMDYVKRLNNYDGPDIAKIALSDQYKLYEEAFFIYKKFKKGPEAIGVLLENIDSMERAVEFAEYWNQPDVWSLLGKAQLDRLMVKECIACFLKADDATFYLDVIRASKGADKYDDLILYLKMARTKVKDVIVDNELIYSYAKTNKLAELEDFLSTSTQAKIQDVGDLCFAESLFEAARILYNHVGNNAKLAICLVRLQRYAEAVEAARKANNVLTWKEVCFACVIAKEFRLAQICAMNVIVYMDHMLDLVKHYERLGYFQELIAVLEQGINLDRAHQGMYTQLGVCYAKYKEEKLMEHIKLFWSRLNIPTLLVACQQNLHWNEAVFLYTHYDQYDNAIDVLITHSAECWEHKLFKEVILQVGNTEIYYRAIRFYLSEHPLLLNDLLLDLAGHLDHHRVVDILTNAEHLPLIEKYLLHVQRDNIPSVNEAINSLFVRQEEYRKLRDSVDAYKNFDQIALAQQLEAHELMEMRRISAHLYKVNKRHDRSIDLSKKDELWQDAADTAADSQDPSLAESLVYFFVEKKLYEVFAAALYTCYELIRPDVVLELSWRNGLMDFAMPFFIQTFREYDEKMKYVHTWIEKKDKEMEAKENEEKKKKEEHQAADTAGFMPMLPMAAPMLALPPAPGFIPAVPGVYGAPAGYAPY